MMDAKKLEGRKIVEAAPVDIGVGRKGVGFVLDDGSMIYATSDEEGNDVGVMILAVGHKDYLLTLKGA